MKYLLFGLGNIGAEYNNTRHNIGFDVLDHLAAIHKVSFTTERLAQRATFRYKSRVFVLLKPTTFMNLSGKAVRYWMDTEKVKIENIAVVTDDLSLDTGVLRMRTKGSGGTHNGLNNIIDVLGRSDFTRLRFGIGNNFSRGRQVDFVLGTWKTAELPIIEDKIPMAAEMLTSFGCIGAARTMNMYNNK